ncbi:putative glycosyltransferase [Methanococcus maripaludis KA1]|uniref:Putative glycosyltransferase n=1 Tax=Methanococcus maripaludis KA1 TaxID=637914 RepID=A0A2Z5PDM2_METMI|nr:glycosyltransferase [Methanococcus maripaludis]BAP60500.1 putative glycosyltransferase [Methanococcus maripaludis KA1]
MEVSCDNVEVSIVISAYTLERMNDIVDLLYSMERQTCQNFEIIFVVDGTYELMNEIKKQVCDVNITNMKFICVGENKGLSNARNLGIANSVGDIIAFIDDDAIADPKWLEKTIESFYKNPEVWGVTGHNEALWVDVKPQKLPKILYWMIGDSSYMFDNQNKVEVRNPCGCNMAFKKFVFDKIGLFSLEFGKKGNLWLFGEDSEIGIRIWKNNGKIIFDPSIKIQHKVYKYRTTFKNILKRTFYEGFSKAYMKKIHGSVLSKETDYLKKLIFEDMPREFQYLFKRPIRGSKNIIIVLCAVFSVGSGYVYGSKIYKK